MREATTQGMSLWIAPLILHAVIAVAITDLADIPFWFVLLAMMVARYIVVEFYTAKLPVARQAESYDAYFNRIADSSDIPAHVKRYAIRKLDYIWLLDTISLIDRWRQETVLKAAMSRYSAKKGQG
jgi:hypothetical protein